MRRKAPVMLGFAWLVFLVSLVLSADFAWDAFRDWRRRRGIARSGRTLTQKFPFPPV